MTLSKISSSDSVLEFCRTRRVSFKRLEFSGTDVAYLGNLESGEKHTPLLENVRIALHALMFLLGLILAYDFITQPTILSYLIASVLFLSYSSFRLYGYRKSRSAKKAHDGTNTGSN